MVNGDNIYTELCFTVFLLGRGEAFQLGYTISYDCTDHYAPENTCGTVTYWTIPYKIKILSLQKILINISRRPRR